MSDSPPAPSDPNPQQQDRSARAVLDLLGLASRARALVTGTDSVRKGVRDGGIFRVLVAADSAEGQRSKLVPLLEARHVPFDVAFTRAQLGWAVGRSPVTAIGISDRNFARRAGELIAALPSL